MKAHLIDTHLVPWPRSSAKVDVKYQGHVYQKMGISGALVFHKHIFLYMKWMSNLHFHYQIFTFNAEWLDLLLSFIGQRPLCLCHGLVSIGTSVCRCVHFDLKYRICIECCCISKIYNEVGRIDNFPALAGKLSFLPTELDIFDIRPHCVHILFIFQV